MQWSKQSPASSKERKPHALHFVLVALWLASVAYAGYYFTSQKLVEFDANLRLSEVAQQDIIEYVTRYEKKALITRESSRGVVYHFVDNTCRCNLYSQAHIDSLSNLASEVAYDVVTIELGDNVRPFFLPSTPATLVLGADNELIYLGPYAQGAYCNEATGVVALSIENYLKGFNANLINNRAQGCYCPVLSQS